MRPSRHISSRYDFWINPESFATEMGPSSDSPLLATKVRIADVEEGLISMTAPGPIMFAMPSTDVQEFGTNPVQTVICALNATARALRSRK